MNELGERHPDTMFARSQLAYFVLQSGDVQRSVELYELVADHRRAALGPRHPHVVDTLRNLVRAKMALSPERAVSIAESLLQDMRDGVGETHPLVPATHLAFVCALLDQDQVARAEDVKTLHASIGVGTPGYVMQP